MAESDFRIEQDGYVAFDAISLKDLIIERMNQQQVFTDQNYEGSNLSAIIDIVAYSYHVLIYYLNKNSSESNFSQAELYENINQIVKSIDYNPTGPQTSNLSFEATANANLATNLYTIPRYSYFTFSGTSFSFTEDVSFQKSLNGIEALTNLQNNTLLYNGQFVEFPVFEAIGENNEVATLAATNLNDNFYIDNNSIDVYVKPVGLNSTWEKWSRSASLYLESGSAKKYSVRFNEEERYEIKFGNNVNGKKLNAGDLVQIYYLKSDGLEGQVSKGTLNNQQLYFYNTSTFNEILTDTTTAGTNIITSAESANVTFTNINSSTLFKEKETVAEIKQNAPNLFNSQYRLVTTDDYKNYISKNFGNWVRSVEVVNNFDYTSIYQKYFFDIGLDRPNDDSRVLFNQINFADACDFNNVYVFAVPNKVLETSLDIRTNYLSVAQKNAINILLSDVKSATTELVVTDPVYMELNLGVTQSVTDFDFANIAGEESYLYVEVDKNSRRDLSSVRNEVASVFLNYFNVDNLNLGQIVSLKDISQLILDIDGVVEFSTRRNTSSGTLVSNLLQVVVYNPVYVTSDFNFTEQDIDLQFFQFPYFKDLSTISERIEVIRQG
jgi:hypothetical protein